MNTKLTHNVKDFLRRVNSRFRYEFYEKNNPGDYISFRAFDYYKCIFIHIPKAAGMSINTTLFGNLGSNHTHLSHFEKLYSKYTFDRYFKFSFVRNPYSRLMSAYYYLKKGGINENDARWAQKNLYSINSFESFVIDFLNQDTIYSYMILNPQVRFLELQDKSIGLDFMGRFETIEEDFMKVASHLKIDKQLKFINKNSYPKDEKIAISREVKEKIYSLYREDFLKLSYKQ